MKKVVFVLVSLLLVGLMVASTSAQGGINPGIGNVNFTVMNISPSTEANVIASYIVYSIHACVPSGWVIILTKALTLKRIQ